MLEVQRQDALRRFQEQQNELYRQKMEKHTQQTTVPSTSLVYGTAMAQPQQQQQMIYANQPRLQQPAAAYNMQVRFCFLKSFFSNLKICFYRPCPNRCIINNSSSR